MDAALKAMFARRQTSDLELAALKEPSSGYRDFAKTALTFRNRLLSRRVELGNEAAAEVLHLGEGVGLAALVDDAKRGSWVNVDGVGFEVPLGVGMSRLCL